MLKRCLNYNGILKIEKLIVAHQVYDNETTKTEINSSN